MERNPRGPQREKKTEALLHENERLNPISVRSLAAQGQIPSELPTKSSRPVLSFLNDDQHDQKHLSVAVSREQTGFRQLNQQEFQTNEDISRGLGEAYSAREQSKQTIRELWKTQESGFNEEDKAAVETKRAQFIADLERAQKKFDFWDDRLRQISFARSPTGFSQSNMTTQKHTSHPFNRKPPRASYPPPTQPDPPRPEPKRQGPPLLRREPAPIHLSVEQREALWGKNTKPEKEPHTSRPSPSVDVHINPKARRDVTLHLDMDLTEDVEEELENFSKLRRIGHFKAAKRYFEEHLEHCIDNVYVLDQYGQFLLEISDVHTLTKLARKYPPGDADKAASANWFLICEQALQFDDDVCPQGNWRKRPNFRKVLGNWPKLDSSELQCLINDLRVVKSNDEIDNGEHTAEEYGDLYAHLQQEDRIWDFRDLCYGLLTTKSLEETIHCLFHRYLLPPNENSAGVIQVIQQHWEALDGDEVTSLALLDIFTAFTMWTLDAASSRYEDSLDDSDELQTAESYLKVAQHYATEVLRQNPLNLKSRPYLQWVIAKVLVEKNTETARHGEPALVKYLSNLRGETRVSPGSFRGMIPFQDTIYYTPNQEEAPDWQPDPSTIFSHEQEKAIQMVARNARELGDVMLEAACLQQRMYSSPNPEVHLVKLCNLWRSVGNRSGLLRAYLYRYILKRSPDASHDLRSDLLELEGIESDIGLQEARLMTLRALSTRSHEKAVYLRRAQDLDDDSYRNANDEGKPCPQPHNETLHSSKNNIQHASNQSINSYSTWGAPISDIVCDSDDASNDGPSSMGSQRSKLHHAGRPTLNKEETSQNKVLQWLNQQPLRKQITAAAFNEADQAELMPPQPTKNILPVRRHSTKTSKDFEHGENSVLGPESRKTTKGSKDMEDTISLVDDQDKQRREKEKNDDPYVGGIEFEDLEPHVHEEEENQEDVQSKVSQVVNYDSTRSPYDFTRNPSRVPFF